MEKRLIIRADVSTQMGTGHLMRCVALAQAWQDSGGCVSVITACQNEALLQRLRDEKFDVHPISRMYPDPGDWDFTRGILAANPSGWVVLDGYHFDEAYQQRIKETGHRLLVIDDLANLNHYYADIILNQNLGAETRKYSREPHSYLLLGTRYVLLRREFLAWSSWQRHNPEIAKKVLVTLGGSDPENMTLKVIQALRDVDMPDLQVTVIIGASNPHFESLEKAVAQSPIPIHLVRDVQNMPELMTRAEVAISSIGSTVWELLFLKIPVLAVVPGRVREGLNSLLAQLPVNSVMLVNIHEPISKAVKLLIENTGLRAEMGAKARRIVDGRGARRVVECMQQATDDKSGLIVDSTG